MEHLYKIIKVLTVKNMVLNKHTLISEKRMLLPEATEVLIGVPGETAVIFEFDGLAATNFIYCI